MIYCEMCEGTVENTKVYGFVFTDAASGEELYVVQDVFTDRAQAVAFRDTVNASEVCREHIRDILEDAMAV